MKHKQLVRMSEYTRAFSVSLILRPRPYQYFAVRTAMNKGVNFTLYTAAQEYLASRIFPPS